MAAVWVRPAQPPAGRVVQPEQDLEFVDAQAAAVGQGASELAVDPGMRGRQRGPRLRA